MSSPLTPAAEPACAVELVAQSCAGADTAAEVVRGAGEEADAVIRVTEPTGSATAGATTAELGVVIGGGRVRYRRQCMRSRCRSRSEKVAQQVERHS